MTAGGSPGPSRLTLPCFHSSSQVLDSFFGSHLLTEMTSGTMQGLSLSFHSIHHHLCVHPRPRSSPVRCVLKEQALSVSILQLTPARHGSQQPPLTHRLWIWRPKGSAWHLDAQIPRPRLTTDTLGQRHLTKHTGHPAG